MTDAIDKVRLHVYDVAMRKVTDEEELLKSRIIDSVGVVDLAVLLENEFDIHIPARDVIPENFSTIASLTKYVNSRLV